MRSVTLVLLALAGLLLSAPEASLQTLASVDSATRRPRAESAAKLAVRGVRVARASVTVDGVLDDSVWVGAETVGGFVQMRPSPGAAATERTEVRVLYDDNAVYVGMRMHDREAGEIAAQLARRDASGIHSDWAHVLIDSYNDRRTAFRFSVNPRGVQKDVMHFDDFSEDVNWDAVWTAATIQDSLGWTAEFRIPLSQLRFGAETDGERVWGVNFSREIARRGEWSWWSPVLPDHGGTVSQSGELRGLQGLEAPRRLEVLPYSVARVTREPGEGANPFYDRTAGAMSFGADLRYGLTSNLTLSATINPDFGQVEADPSEVNLSGFESFFAEKRPFFMEGANIFSFNVGTDDNSGEALFYSRRIGRAPQRAVDLDGGWEERPEATTILGAAKLSGKTASGWTIGVLDAITTTESSRIATAGGLIHSEAVEPRTNYAVMSLSRDFRRGGSTLGIMSTATNRDLGGADDFGFLRTAAYSTGVTGRHRFAADRWEASAYLAGSHIRGSEEAILRVQRGAGHYFQRPDADYVEVDSSRTALTGAVGSFWIGKIAGGNLRGGFGGHLRTPGLELNDLGFMAEADQMQLFGNLRYVQNQPRGILRNWSVGVNPFSMWSTGGERIFTQLGHNVNMQFSNLWSGGWWVGTQFESLNTGALRGGPGIVRPGGVRYSTWWNTDPRKAVNFSANVWGGAENDSGRWDYGVSTRVSFRPTTQATLSLEPNYNRNHNSWQYVTQQDGAGARRYVFSTLDQNTVGLTTRLNYTISPTLSVELYAQPFVSAGDYEGFKEVSDPRASHFADRFRAYQGELTYDAAAQEYAVDVDGDAADDFAFDDPDFNFKEFRSNAVLRWEYRPGSTLFVVWGQGRSDSVTDGSFSPDRDFGRLFGMENGYDVPATNVLLVKLNYWVNF